MSKVPPTIIQQLLADGESEQAEFKQRVTRLDQVGQNVCAFLNTKGGTLLIGVDERGIQGVKSPESLQDRIQQDLASHISPLAYWSVNVEEVEGKQVVVIDVPVGMEKPYVYRDKIYSRTGARTTTAGKQRISGLIEERHLQGSRWERLPAHGVAWEDFDQKEVRDAMQQAQAKGLYRYDGTIEVERVFEELRLASAGLILNSGVVLFCKHAERAFPQTRVRGVRYDSNDPDTLRDNRLFEGHAFSLLDQMEQFLALHLPIRSELPKDGFVRKDEPALPPAAVREGLLNALMHRDYAAFDGSIQIGVYDDRVEIWNPGLLPEGMTVQQLKEKHSSRPRNPDLTHVFFIRGMIERIGVGTRRIVRECVAAGLPEPVWSTDSGGVRLTLKLGARKLSGTKSVQITYSYLNSRQDALLKKLKPGQGIGPAEYFEMVKDEVGESRARKDLAELVSQDFLRREGSTTSRRYVRTDKAIG